MHEMELENAKFTSAARLWVSSISVSLGAVYRTYAVSNYEDLVSSWTRMRRLPCAIAIPPLNDCRLLVRVALLVVDL